jgi:hypothetical protein
MKQEILLKTAPFDVAQGLGYRKIKFIGHIRVPYSLILS